MHPRRLVSALVLAALLLPALPGIAQERDRTVKAEDLHKILDGLEHGVAALKHLGRHEEARALNRIADEVRREIRQEKERRREGGDWERQIVKHQIEVLKMARAALDEAGKRDAADMARRAIRVREINLEGRRDEEAQEIRRRAPSREETIKLLRWAEKLYRKWGDEEKAEKLSRMTEKLWSRPEDRPHSGRSERDQVRREIEILSLAKPALREAGRMDSLEILEHAIHARELALEGRRDEHAMHIRKTAPDMGAQIEVLAYSARLWREFGNEDKAEVLERLAHELKARRKDRLSEGRELLKHEIEVFGIAAHAFEEAEKPDAADIMRRAAHVRKLRLSGRRGEEAERVLRSAPSPEQEMELLGHASRLWEEWGHEEKARALDKLAGKMRSHLRDHRPRREEGPRERQIDQLHQRMDELERAIRALREELEHLRHSY
jgi:hypothetical protein